MMQISKEIESKLFALRDENYAKFHSRLMPTVCPQKIIGVQVPKLRALAKEYKGHPKIGEFLGDLPHEYYEQNNLHAFLIEQIADFEKCVAKIEEFLPYVDNWATCDSMRPKCFKSNKEALLVYLKKWLKSSHPYTQRYAIEMLMVHFLDEDFKPEYLSWVAKIRSKEYYVNMMCAWYFATALSKQWEDTIVYFDGEILSKDVSKKAIKKALESFRITSEQKAQLKQKRG